MVFESGAVKPLPDEQVKMLDEADRKLRHAAVQTGHTQPVVIVPAKRARVRAIPDCSPPLHLLRPGKRLRTKTQLAQINFVVKPASQ